MPEEKLSIKRMILLGLIVWILSLASVLAVVYVVMPNIVRPTLAWHEVTKFSGTFQEWQSEDTDSFHIQSDHWRLYWTVTTDEPPPEDVEFRLFLSSNSTYGYYNARSLVWLKFADFQPSRNVEDGMDWWGYKEGTEYIIGSGRFSFRVRGARLNWEITVESYY